MSTFVLLAFSLVGATSSDGSSGPPVVETCDDVGGPFFSTLEVGPGCVNSPIGMCTHGVLKGNLAGTYEMTFLTLEPTANPTTMAYTGTSAVTLTTGQILYTQDSGTLVMGPNGYSFSTSASAFTGTDFFEDASGGFTASGDMDPASGVSTGKYKGNICLTCQLGPGGSSCLQALSGS